MNRVARTFGALAGILLMLVGCNGESGGTGQLAVLMTDAPIDNVETAVVWVSSVYVIGGDDTNGTHFVVLSTPQSYDLLDLTNGATAALGVVTLPTGSYSQLRFVVDSARVTLKAPMTFSDGSTSKTMKTPSGQQSGIKVNFAGPINVTQGQTVLVVDFDVSRNFVFTGPPGSPTGVLFKPVLHATVQDVAGSIAGNVTPLNSKAHLYAIMNGDTVTSAIADSVTGNYKLWFLPPGPYTVGVTATGLQPQTATTTVGNGQAVVGVNFALVP